MACLKLRGSTYYAQYYLGSRQKRVCLRTESLQVAKEKIRALESRLAQDGTTGLPTRTPIAEVLTAYVQHIRAVKTAKSAQTDTYYLREAFGPGCDALRITSRKVTEASRKRCLTAEGRRERPDASIEAACFEQVTTAQVGDWIAAKVRSRGLQPKTANRCREIMHRLYQWAVEQRGLACTTPTPLGSQLAQKGESLFRIATLMGISPEICRRHYAAVAPELLSQGVEFALL